MLIQKLRLQRGWSQEQLAAVSGLSVRTVQRLERGQPGSLESMNALAAAFEIDLSHLTEPTMQPLETDHLDNDEALALKRVRNIKTFYVRLFRYVLIVTALAAINLATNRDYLWFIWPAVAMGIGLAVHGVAVLGLPFLDGNWERRQVEKVLGRKL